MLNTLDTYAHSGKIAAQARNNGDEALYQHEKRWVTHALALESPDNHRRARAAYDEAYGIYRRTPPPLYFI